MALTAITLTVIAVIIITTNKEITNIGVEIKEILMETSVEIEITITITLTIIIQRGRLIIVTLKSFNIKLFQN